MFQRRPTCLGVLLCAAARASDWGDDFYNAPQPPPPPPPQQAYYDPAYAQPPPHHAPQPYGDAGASQAAYEAAEAADLKSPPRDGVVVRVASAASGGLVGAGLGKAVTGDVSPRWAGAGAAACVAAGLCGGRFGDAAVALGATAVGSAKRSRALADGRYPVFRQFKAGLGLVPREVWPPGAPNPWRYAKASREDPDFSMARTLVAAVAVGGLSANCVPFLNMFPSSLVAALAAGCALFAVTLNDARGDAARCVCARFVASVAAVLAAAGDAELGKKSMVAARLGGLRLNAFDRRFGISKTVGGLVSKAVDQAASAQQAPPAKGGDRRPPPPPAYDRPPPPPPPPQQDGYAAPGGDWGLPQDDYYRR